MTVALSVRDLTAGYSGVPVVRGLSLEVGRGEVVALLGPNGAGKTTVVRTLFGLLPAIGGGMVVLGSPARGERPERLARRGLALVPEHRGVFHRLTTRQNLRLAATREGDLALATTHFPALSGLLHRRAGLLSGGEQQMLSLARAIIRRPRLLLVDELSHGLAPVIVDELLPIVRDLADRTGCGVLLVEQHADLALEVADRAYVIAHGELVASGTAAAIAGSRSALADAYLARRAAPAKTEREDAVVASDSTFETEDGRKLGYGEAGDPDGFPVVYLHASMGSRTVPSLWDREARAAGVRLITPERPGFGLSDFVPGYRLLDWPDDLAALCGSLGIDRFAVCGLSGGGPFVLACAYALAGRVTAAACMAGLAPLDRDGAFDGFRESERGVYDVAMRSPEAGIDIAREMKRQVRESPEVWRAAYRGPEGLSEEDGDEVATYVLETVVLETTPEGVAHEWWLYCQPWGFPLSDVRVPVDLWHSEDDDMLPSHHPEYLAAHLPDARLRVWPDGGHLAGAARIGEVLRALSER